MVRSAPGVTTKTKSNKSGGSSDVDEAKPKERRSSKESNKNGVAASDNNGKEGKCENGNGSEASQNGDQVVEDGDHAKDVDLVSC